MFKWANRYKSTTITTTKTFKTQCMYNNTLYNMYVQQKHIQKLLNN